MQIDLENWFMNRQMTNHNSQVGYMEVVREKKKMKQKSGSA